MNKIFSLPKQINDIITKLNAAGFEAYVIGGAIRDMLMGKEPHDYDLATSALPDDVVRIFSEYTVIPTGISHGTVTVIRDGFSVEVTSFRTDGHYKDNRHPESISFTSSLKEDVKRRDFTINAIAYNEKEGVIDHFNGKSDIESKIIRCVGVPDKRFQEDALRILRALRFSSCLGFEIDKETSIAVKKHAHLLKTISAERIFSEFSKLLCGKNVKNVLIEYHNVIEQFIPEIHDMKGFDQQNPHHIYDVWTHTAVCVESIPATPSLRLAAFFHDIGKPSTFSTDENGVGHFYSHSEKSRILATSILQRLKADNFTQEKVYSIIKYHDLQIQEDKKLIKKYLRRLSPDLFFDLIKIFKADNKAQNPAFSSRQDHFANLERIANEIIDEEACFSLSDLAINGRDIMDLGVPQGKAVGIILEELLEAVINEDIPNERDALLFKARECFNSHSI